MVEQRYQAVLAVITDGLSVSTCSDEFRVAARCFSPAPRTIDQELSAVPRATTHWAGWPVTDAIRSYSWS